MQRFFVTPVLDRGKQYYVANYPRKRERWNRRSAGREQKKFARREAAERFLVEAKREWKRSGGVNLAEDRALHYDAMRAVGLIADIPGGSLEKGAELLRMCVSAREYRGSGFEVGRDRRVELDPRSYLCVQNEARRRSCTLSETLRAIVLTWAEREAEVRLKERAEQEKWERGLAARERERANAARRVWEQGKREARRREEREAKRLNQALKQICPMAKE